MTENHPLVKNGILDSNKEYKATDLINPETGKPYTYERNTQVFKWNQQEQYNELAQPLLKKEQIISVEPPESKAKTLAWAGGGVVGVAIAISTPFVIWSAMAGSVEIHKKDLSAGSGFVDLTTELVLSRHADLNNWTVETTVSDSNAKVKTVSQSLTEATVTKRPPERGDFVRTIAELKTRIDVAEADVPVQGEAYSVTVSVWKNSWGREHAETKTFDTRAYTLLPLEVGVEKRSDADVLSVRGVEIDAKRNRAHKNGRENCYFLAEQIDGDHEVRTEIECPSDDVENEDSVTEWTAIPDLIPGASYKVTFSATPTGDVAGRGTASVTLSSEGIPIDPEPKPGPTPDPVVDPAPAPSPNPVIIPTQGIAPITNTITSPAVQTKGVKVLTKRANLSKSGKAKVKLRCENPNGCTGKITLTAKAPKKRSRKKARKTSILDTLIATTSKKKTKRTKTIKLTRTVKYRLKQGQTKTITLKISKSKLRKLGNKRTHTTTLTITPTGQTTQTKTTHKLKLKTAKTKKRKKR